MPGLAVHVPVVLLSLAAGALLGRGSAWLPAFLAIYLVVGLYGGRDLAILAHYNGLITIAVWISFLVLLLAPRWVGGVASAIRHQSPVWPVAITATILAAFIAHAVRWSRP
jgi:hypothetical protein